MLDQNKPDPNQDEYDYATSIVGMCDTFNFIREDIISHNRNLSKQMGLTEEKNECKPS